jgi:hypothetical protein
MPRIVDDPTRAVCPSFEDPEWEFLRLSAVNTHQGDQPLSLAKAAQQMKDAWSRENQCKIVAWNDQLQQNQAEKDEQDRVARDEEEAQQAQREKEAEEMCKEADKKKPKLNAFDPKRSVEKWIEPRPVSYALNKLNNLEYVELDYFTTRGCKDAAADNNKSVSHDTLAFTQMGDTFALRPMAALRPSKHIRNDEDLSWEEMLDAKNIMLHFMAKSGLWPVPHASSIISFYLNLEAHPRKGQKNGKKALMLYQSRVRREWFDALKRDEGFNIELIQEEYLRTVAEEINDSIQDRDNAIRDREFDQVRSSYQSRRICRANSSSLFPSFSFRAPYAPLLPFAVCHAAIAVAAVCHYCRLPLLLSIFAIAPNLPHAPLGCAACCSSPAVRHLPFAAYRLPFAICRLPSAVCRLPFAPLPPLCANAPAMICRFTLPLPQLLMQSASQNGQCHFRAAELIQAAPRSLPIPAPSRGVEEESPFTFPTSGL